MASRRHQNRESRDCADNDARDTTRPCGPTLDRLMGNILYQDVNDISPGTEGGASLTFRVGTVSSQPSVKFLSHVRSKSFLSLDRSRVTGMYLGSCSLIESTPIIPDALELTIAYSSSFTWEYM